MAAQDTAPRDTLEVDEQALTDMTTAEAVTKSE